MEAAMSRNLASGLVSVVAVALAIALAFAG
jgi:hypothetical protein